jgi:hypothetical protein
LERTRKIIHRMPEVVAEMQMFESGREKISRLIKHSTGDTQMGERGREVVNGLVEIIVKVVLVRGLRFDVQVGERGGEVVERTVVYG